MALTTLDHVQARPHIANQAEARLSLDKPFPKAVADGGTLLREPSQHSLAAEKYDARVVAAFYDELAPLVADGWIPPCG